MSDKSDTAKPETYTLQELIQKDESERRERLQYGVRDGDFRVYFQRSNLTIQIEYNGTQWYEIDLERCNSSNELLDWIFHIHGKNWGHLLYTILLVLDDACQDVYRKSAKSLFQPGQTVDWKSKTVSLEKVRFNLDLSPELTKTLGELATKIGGTKADVLRQAIALIQIMVTANEQGKKFGIAEPGQPLATEIIIP